jgi:hypothetical protein
MPLAVLKNGVIHPIDPLPVEWEEGQVLSIEPVAIAESDDEHGVDPAFIDRWLAEMNALCADADPEEDAKLQAALDELRRQGKELMRKEMGLPG